VSDIDQPADPDLSEEEWKRKLLAFLHDPPEKALDVPEHTKRRESHVNRAMEGEMVQFGWFFDRICDHTAAAADRFCFPRFPHGAASFDPSSGAPFHHPLGSSAGSSGGLTFDGKCPSADHASEMLRAAQERLGLDGKSFEDRFWLHWRFWQEEVSEGVGNNKHPSMAFLPADTRIPDHTIWTHCSVTSALQTCVETEETPEGTSFKEFRPAFLVMQFGPVQEFIAQARTTRDLWSGSYLLSWIVAHAIKAITDRIGPDAVLFPALCGQPLFDFLNKARYERMGRWLEFRDGRNVPLHSDEQILTPNLPNRFLAIVPESRASDLAREAKLAAEVALRDVVATPCWEWLVKHHLDQSPGGEARKRWDQQIAQFLSISWQVVPWRNRTVAESLDRFESLPAGKTKAEGASCSPAEALRRAHKAAIDGIPDALKDPRNYRHKSWQDADGSWRSELVFGADGKAQIDNPAFAWAAHYAEVEFLLAARRNVRDFNQWGQWDNGKPIDLAERHAVKDSLSGKEEVIGSEDWQKKLSEINGHFFRSSDRLGAINLIKRVWHRAVLEESFGLKRTPQFDSVSAVAAADWVTDTMERLKQDPEAWATALDFQRHLISERKALGIDVPEESDGSAWFEKIDAEIFHSGTWNRAVGEEAPSEDPALSHGCEQARSTAQDLLRKLHKSSGKTPSRYVAILAMDGDSMGKWVSGAMSPPWRTQLAEITIKDFFANESIVGHEHRSRLLESPRHVSPSYHLQFSEALANFSIYLAGVIVEHFDGQLIYSGGDDVMAIIPARKALACALALRKAFRGERDLSSHFPGCLESHAAHDGFVALDGQAAAFGKTHRFLPRGVPLIVPGPAADISAGMAFGHMQAPLQNLVQAAHHALARAKAVPGKAAFGVTLFKRSGETIEWSAKWDSLALRVAAQFQDLTEDERISGKFPYALSGLLRAYAASAQNSDWKIAASGEFDPMIIFPREIAHVLSRQSDAGWTASEREGFQTLVVDYLTNDCSGRPLNDFLGPFLTTAFINRNAD